MDLIISNNVPEVTNYHTYYLSKNIEMLWEKFSIAIATNWVNNVTFA